MEKSSDRYFAVYKPFGMLSRFSREGDHPTLADLDFLFPKDVYPIGRLDADSEGLLLLTSERTLNKSLLDPDFGHQREYWVQVEGIINMDALVVLQSGPSVSINGKPYKTRPCQARILEELPQLPERNPPIRFRKSVPDSWISLTLHEGKNRQVRKMTAAVGFPTLRLIRVRIGSLLIPEWRSGSVVELSRTAIMQSRVDIS
ncbi:MAG: pseudouridine synthase [Bacteroidota bacterium]